MTDIDVENIIKVIADSLKSKVDLQQLSFQKQGLATQSEQAVYDVICELVEEGSIPVCEEIIYDELSHQFPDIVINFVNGYSLGVEVKSSSSVNNSWGINGNSVLGSTSVEVDDMYIIFIKFNPKNGFAIKYARYEDSIADVVVTHSPRYKIDLNLDPKNSFFHRSGISYNEIKASENPIALITDYFRKEGKTAWWLGSDSEETSSSATILSWSDINTQLREKIYGQAFVLFPEIINGSPRNKYSRLAIWLVAKYSIADSSLRDKFSAGGKVDIAYRVNDEKVTIKGVAKVYETLSEHKNAIKMAFDELVLTELQEFWQGYNPNADTSESRKQYWFNLFKSNEENDELLNYIVSLLEIDIP